MAFWDDLKSTLPDTLFAFELTGAGEMRLEFYLPAVVAVVTVALLFWWLIWRRAGPFGRVKDFEIDEATLGVGDHRLKLRPNDTDRQIAYAIWVELSTRKLGLPIDPEHDVIHEVYDSWYAFFGVARELIKDVPVYKLRRRDTLQVVELSLRVLNDGMRPHLTKWQARYRHWYSQAKKQTPETPPQALQQTYPEANALWLDLLEVNKQLIEFRKSMRGLAIAS